MPALLLALLLHGLLEYARQGEAAAKMFLASGCDAAAPAAAAHPSRPQSAAPSGAIRLRLLRLLGLLGLLRLLLLTQPRHKALHCLHKLFWALLLRHVAAAVKHHQLQGCT